MKKRSSEVQIVAVLKEAEAGLDKAALKDLLGRKW
jgi:hypothetical protein